MAASCFFFPFEVEVVAVAVASPLAPVLDFLEGRGSTASTSESESAGRSRFRREGPAPLEVEARERPWVWVWVWVWVGRVVGKEEDSLRWDLGSFQRSENQEGRKEGQQGRVEAETKKENNGTRRTCSQSVIVLTRSESEFDGS